MSDRARRALLMLVAAGLCLAILSACSPTAAKVAATATRSGAASRAESADSALEFVMLDSPLWQRTADGGYAASGDEDTFAWSTQAIQGDFELSADVESDFSNYGEAIILVYGNRQGWTPGCLIFNVAGYWQGIRAHTVYDPGVRWIATREQRLDLTRKRYRMTVRVADGMASLLVDDRLVASGALPPELNGEGYVALAKWGGSAPVTFDHIMLKTQGSASASASGVSASATGASATPTTVRTATSTPRPTATPPPTNTPLPTRTPPPTLTSTPSVTPTPTATPSPTATPEPDVIVERAAVQLRQGPGTEYPALEEIKAGAELQVLGQYGGCAWLWVAYGEGDGWIRRIEGTVDLRLPCDGIPPGLYRPFSGYIKRGGDGRGYGKLKVENGTDQDAVLVLVDGEQPVMSAYVRAGETFQMEGIRDGVFELYFASGELWNGSAFTKISSRRKFEDALPFETTQTTYSTWSVTLHAVPGGQARAEQVGADEFPSLGD